MRNDKSRIKEMIEKLYFDEYLDPSEIAIKFGISEDDVWVIMNGEG